MAVHGLYVVVVVVVALSLSPLSFCAALDQSDYRGGDLYLFWIYYCEPLTPTVIQSILLPLLRRCGTVRERGSEWRALRGKDAETTRASSCRQSTKQQKQ